MPQLRDMTWKESPARGGHFPSEAQRPFPSPRLEPRRTGGFKFELTLRSISGKKNVQCKRQKCSARPIWGRAWWRPGLRARLVGRPLGAEASAGKSTCVNSVDVHGRSKRSRLQIGKERRPRGRERPGAGEFERVSSHQIRTVLPVLSSRAMSL